MKGAIWIQWAKPGVLPREKGDIQLFTFDSYTEAETYFQWITKSSSAVGEAQLFQQPFINKGVLRLEERFYAEDFK